MDSLFFNISQYLAKKNPISPKNVRCEN